MAEYAVKCLGQYNTRHLLVPPANGVDYRIHNGYLYLSPIAVAPEKIAERVPHFLERAGFYFQNWNKLLDNWHVKVRGVIDALEALRYEPLPDMVPKEWMFEGRGLDNTYYLMESLRIRVAALLQGLAVSFRVSQSRLRGLSRFLWFLQRAIPQHSGSGDRPNGPGHRRRSVSARRRTEEACASGCRNRRRRCADERLGRTGAWLRSRHSPRANSGSKPGSLRRIRGSTLPRGTASTHPTNIGSSTSIFRSDTVRNYIVQLRKGITIERPTAKVAAERERITKEYAELLNNEVRPVFEQKLGLARTVFPYVENHNFYIEHWSLGVFWRKMRELNQLFITAGFWSDPEGLFFLSRNEVRDALWDYCSAWAVGGTPTGPHFWPQRIAQRRKTMDALAQHRPEPALNEPPEVVTEPFTIMLWGITSDRISAWLKGPTDSSRLEGMGASPGDRRRSGARYSLARRTRSDPGRRNSRRTGHGAQLGPGFQQDQRHRNRHRRDDVARGHCVPRIRTSRRHGDRIGERGDQNRPEAAGRRHRRHGRSAGELNREP